MDTRFSYPLVTPISTNLDKVGKFKIIQKK